MVDRKIVWSHRARTVLVEILEFYRKRNGNTIYSSKLFREFNFQINKLSQLSELGIETDMSNIRGLIIKKTCDIL